MHIGPFDWIFLACVGVAAIYLAVDTAVKQSEPRASLAAKLPPSIRTPKWAYLPLALMIFAGVILVLRAGGVVGPESHMTANPAPPPATASPTAKAPAGQLASPEPKIFVDVSPGYLLGLYEKRTTAEANRIVAPYLGKWIKFSGSVFNVSETDLSAMISFRVEDKLAFMIFDKASVERVSLLRVGQAASMVCRISEVSAVAFTATKCELN